MDLLSRRAGRALGLAVALLAGVQLACSDGAETYDATGVVEDVQRETGQVVIDHDDIPGLMPAMTMSFDVTDAALLDRLESGQVIDFEIRFDGRSYVVSGANVRDRVEPREGFAVLGDRLVRAEPAPPFRLIDQEGDPLALSDLAGQVLLLDFIFTHCPGPCPILTGLHVSAQRGLPEDLRDRVRFVSISLDPLRDTPEAMREYARARGADLEHWSFLTGDPDVVAEVVRAYGIGTTRSEDGEIEHVVATFVIDGQARIVKRFLGLQHDPEELVKAIERVARAEGAGGS